MGAGKLGGLEPGLVQQPEEGWVSREQLQVGARLLLAALRGPWISWPGGRPWGEEPEAPHCPSARGRFRSPRSLDLTGPLLLGGVPDLPESFPVRTRHFVGCMRNLQVDSRHVDMADFIANNGTVPGRGAGPGPSAGGRRCAWCGPQSPLQPLPQPPPECPSLHSRLPCQEECVRQQHLPQWGHLCEPVGCVQLPVPSGLRGQELCPG